MKITFNTFDNNEYTADNISPFKNCLMTFTGQEIAVISVDGVEVMVADITGEVVEFSDINNRSLGKETKMFVETEFKKYIMERLKVIT